MLKRGVDRYIFDTYFSTSTPPKQRRWVQRIYKEVAGALLSDREWETLTRFCYDSRLFSSPIYSSDRLFAWEEAALESYFPPPPASILILAAGKGREMRGLQKLGYRVFGIDQDGRAIQEAKETCNPELLIGASQSSFYEIATTGSLPDEKFDGIVIGWGALSHLSSEATAQKLFSLISERYAEVPILLSWCSIESQLLSMKLYRRLRSSFPLFSSFFQGTLDPYLGPMRVITYSSLGRFLKRCALKELHRGKSGEYKHMVVMKR